MEFQVQQDAFNGPLNILLDLIEKEKLAISQISLAKITNDFLTHLNTLETIDREKLGEFLIIAAQLMLIKSRALLPSITLSSEEEQSISELEDRLRWYKYFRERARELEQCEQKKQRMFARPSSTSIHTVFYPPPHYSGEALKTSFAAFLHALPKMEKLAEEKLHRGISLEEKIHEIRTLLETGIVQRFYQVAARTRDKGEIIVSFLAILELARQQLVRLEQSEPFSHIHITNI